MIIEYEMREVALHSSNRIERIVKQWKLKWMLRTKGDDQADDTSVA
jgi:hypothetical protein